MSIFYNRIVEYKSGITIPNQLKSIINRKEENNTLNDLFPCDGNKIVDYWNNIFLRVATHHQEINNILDEQEINDDKTRKIARTLLKDGAGKWASKVKIIRQDDEVFKKSFNSLYQLCPLNSEQKTDDFWAKIFLRIARDINEINTVINEWPLTVEAEKIEARKSLKNSPKHLAIALEHYCKYFAIDVEKKLLISQIKTQWIEDKQYPEKTDKDLERMAQREAYKQLENQQNRVSLGYFIQVVQRTKQPYQIPSEQQCLFTNEQIAQAPIFANFQLTANKPLKNWLFLRLKERTFEEIQKSLQTDDRDNPWKKLYTEFCAEFSQMSPKKLTEKLTEKLSEDLKIADSDINFYRNLILAFIHNYELTTDKQFGGKPRYNEPKAEQLQRIADKFNELSSLKDENKKDGTQIKTELYNFYAQFISTDLPPDSSTISINSSSDNDDKPQSTIDIPDPKTTPSATEDQENTKLIAEQLPELLKELDKFDQVLLMLEYGFEDNKIFMTEKQQNDVKLPNVKLDQKEIGQILGIPQYEISKNKDKALKKLTGLIFKNNNYLSELPVINGDVSLSLEAINKLKTWLNTENQRLSFKELKKWFKELKNNLKEQSPLDNESLGFIRSWILHKGLLEKPLLPDHYFNLIRSWFVDDLAKISIEQRNIPEIKELLKAQIKLKFIIEINKAQILVTSETLKLLDPPIDRLLEKYVKQYNIFT